MTAHTLLLLDVFLPIFLGIVTLSGVLCGVHRAGSTPDQAHAPDLAGSQPGP
ncbi:MAG: hypothetical protein ACKN9W_18150 [Methylococcus sp.]